MIMNEFELLIQLSLLLPMLLGIGAAAGIKLGLGGLSGLFGLRGRRKAEQERLEEDRRRRSQEFEIEQGRRKDEVREAISKFLADARLETERRGVAGLEATQLDPLSQPKARFRGDIARDLGGFDVSGGAPFRTTSTALSPEAQQRAEEFFARNVGEVSPRVPLPSTVPGAEQFRTGRLGEIEAEQDTERQRLEDFLQNIGGCQPGTRFNPRTAKCDPVARR